MKEIIIKSRLIQLMTFLAFTLCYTGASDPLVISTSKGKVRGKTVDALGGKTVDVWYGIPYAQPPLGELRFKHPRPAKSWSGILETKELPNSCFQTMDTFYGDFPGSTMWNANTMLSEDCLYLSVIVPKPRPNNAAVMVWIYGGGFFSGTSTLDVYDYRTLAAEQNVIVVAPQYRVASLGFLYMGTTDAPGNNGLFDQLMSLEWIRENIHKFGGNPHKVTLMGESAGAASVSMHLLSPLSRGLFSQAIMQSGAATSPSVMIDQEESIKRGLELAATVGCPHSRENLTAVMQCLRKTDPIELVYNEPYSSICDFPFVSIVDGVFLDEKPIDSLKKGNFKKTDILLGSNTEEGNWFIMYYLPELFRREEGIKISRKDFEKSVNELFPFLKPLAREAIKHEYSNWLDLEDGEYNRDAIDKMIGDYHFTCNVNEFASYYANDNNNVFMYYFTHRSSQHLWPKWTGVLHGDEINYIFGEPLSQKHKYSDEERLLSKQMMTFWTNFAKTGNPNLNPDTTCLVPNWPVHTPKGREYLVLEEGPSRILTEGPRIEKCAFWKEFLPILLKHQEVEDAKQQKCQNKPVKSCSLDPEINQKFNITISEGTISCNNCTLIH